MLNHVFHIFQEQLVLLII